jgi:hypothetical protein
MTIADGIKACHRDGRQPPDRKEFSTQAGIDIALT